MRRTLLHLAVLLVACLWAAFLHSGIEGVKQSWTGYLKDLSDFRAWQQQSEQSSVGDSTTPSVASARPDWDDPDPILPATLFGVVADPLRIYFDNIILARDIDAYDIEVKGQPGLEGRSHRRFWELVPDKSDVGTHSLTVTVRNIDKGTIVANRKINLVISDNDASSYLKKDGILSVLMVGDSLTHQSGLPNRLYRLLDTVTDKHVRFVGTHHPVPDFPFYERPDDAVFHEGYGGWTWDRFATHYDPGKSTIFNAARSPFVFLEDGAPKIDIKRYLAEQGIRNNLDVAVFQLGVNDAFGFTPDDPNALAASLDILIGQAKYLLSAFHAASPGTRLLVLTPPYFTNSEAVFERKYGAGYGGPTRLRRILHALIREMIVELENFDGVTLVPTHVMLDTVDGYYAIDPGHPNDLGNLEQAYAVKAAVLAGPINAERR